MTYRKYPGTPRLDQYVAQEIINMQEDSFKANPLRDMMNASTMQADILSQGDLGYTEPNKNEKTFDEASLSSKRTSGENQDYSDQLAITDGTRIHRRYKLPQPTSILVPSAPR